MNNSDEKTWKTLERKWQQLFQEKEVEVPDVLWNRLEQKLSEEAPQKKHKGGLFFWSQARFAVVAASILLVSGFAWVFFIPSGEDSLSKPTFISSNLNHRGTNLNERAAEAAPSPTEMSLKKLDRQGGQATKVEKVEIDEDLQARTSVPTVQSPLIEFPSNTLAKTEPAVSEVSSEPVEELWIKVEINPAKEEQMATTEFPKKKKRMVNRLVAAVKSVLNGEGLELNRMRSDKVKEGIHQVANQYFKTEEQIKRIVEL